MSPELTVAARRPRVSVIIPAHNSAPFIAEAIEGVLVQTYRDFEIVVVDDGSNDHTGNVVKQFGSAVHYHRQSNQGVAAARNAGIQLTAGEFVCLLDADDVWMPEKLARQLEFIAAHPDVGLLFSDAFEFEGNTIHKASILATMTFGVEAKSQVPIPDAFRKLLISNFIPTSSVMIRRSCFAVTGLFDAALPNAEDRDMWLRLAAHFPIACLPQVLARKRSHGANISARTELALRSRLRVWEQARRRFPALAPAAVYNQLLAETHQQLGYIVLARGERRAARRHALASLKCAIRSAGRTTAPVSYRWVLAIALVPLSFLRWRFVQVLWQTRNALLRRRNTAPAVAV